MKLDPALADPFGVTVACGAFPSSAGAPSEQRYDAWVTYLRAASSLGWLTRVSLQAPPFLPVNSDINVGKVSTHTSVYDSVSTRLFVSARFDPGVR